MEIFNVRNKIMLSNNLLAKDHLKPQRTELRKENILYKFYIGPFSAMTPVQTGSLTTECIKGAMLGVCSCTKFLTISKK